MGFDITIGASSANKIDSSSFKINTGEVDSTKKDSKTFKIKDKDSINISAEGLKKAADEKPEEESKEEQTIKKLRKRIKQIEAELKELRQNPEQNKKAIKAKEMELQQYQSMLMEILKKQTGGSGCGQLGAGGGTPAKGSSGSLA